MTLLCKQTRILPMRGQIEETVSGASADLPFPCIPAMTT
jgi:hypothetical protein